jgi:hypothetical protein
MLHIQSTVGSIFCLLKYQSMATTSIVASIFIHVQIMRPFVSVGSECFVSILNSVLILTLHCDVAVDHGTDRQPSLRDILSTQTDVNRAIATQTEIGWFHMFRRFGSINSGDVNFEEEDIPNPSEDILPT